MARIRQGHVIKRINAALHRPLDREAAEVVDKNGTSPVSPPPDEVAANSNRIQFVRLNRPRSEGIATNEAAANTDGGPLNQLNKAGVLVKSAHQVAADLDRPAFDGLYPGLRISRDPHTGNSVFCRD